MCWVFSCGGVTFGLDIELEQQNLGQEHGVLGPFL